MQKSIQNLILLAAIAMMFGCDKFAEGGKSSGRSVVEIDKALVDLDARVERLERLTKESRQMPAQKWVLWRFDVIKGVAIGVGESPPSPLDAFAEKEECILATRKQPRESGVAGQSFRVEFEYRCLPESVLPKNR